MEQSSDQQWQEKVLLASSRFASRLQALFQAQIASNPADFKAFVLKCIRKALPSSQRGRRTDPHIEAAIHLLAQGKTVKEILRLQAPNFDSLDSYEQYLAEKGLRTAIARRRKIRGYRKLRIKTDQPTIREEKAAKLKS